MFRLDQAIAEWRNQIAAQGIKSRKVLDELESHLREGADRRLRAGEEAAKAFQLAAREVGDAAVLKAEFAKANGARPVVEKLMLAVCVVFMALITFLSGAAVVMCFASLADRIVSGVGMVATLAVACFWARAVPVLPVIAGRRVRIVASLLCILAGIGIATFYCQWVLPLFGLPDHQLPAAGFWMLLPVAAGLGLGCGIELAGRRHTVQMAS